MRRLALILGLLGALLSPAAAEDFVNSGAATKNAPGVVLLCWTSAQLYLPCSSVTPLSVNIISGGGSGGTFNNNADNVATSATNGQAAAWTYVWDGSAWDRLYGDSVLGAFVQVKASVLPTGASTAANQTNASQKTQMVDGSGNVISATGNALDVNVKTVATKTGVVATTTTITLGGTSQTLFAAGTILNGAFLTNPATATEVLCIDPTGAAATTTAAGSTFCLGFGQSFTIPVGWTNAVTVNAATTSHAFSAVRY